MSIFNTVQATKPPSNTFDLSHDRKMSCKMGELTPILAMDILPGDKITLSTTQMLRFAPMTAPVMHKINIFTHFYFVPNRLSWKNWEAFITGGEDGTNDSIHPFLRLDQNENLIGGLPDHMGIPVTTLMDQKPVNAFPFAAYQLIWNEYYRDQNLQNAVDAELDDAGANNTADFIKMRFRAYQHDYFTSALPWTQKGVEATIPLGSTANVRIAPDNFSRESQKMRQYGTGTNITNLDLATGSNGAFGDTGNTDEWFLDLGQSHYADLSNATAASINDLRQAFKLQEWLEKNARGGTRYNESMKSHFGVISPDARLQRPEYLGGGQNPVVISEVLQTQGTPFGESPTTTPQATMAGHGISVGTMNNFTYRATEHGYIIGIMSILPKTAYYQGLPKHFSKFDKFDYYWPSFAHLGEQAIQNQELYVQGDLKDEETFGYTPRYAEYKFMHSSVHGEFRDTLEFWHMARKFSAPLPLNEQFITADPTDNNLQRIFAVQNVENIYAHIHHKISAKRLMPVFGTPHL